MQVIHLQMLLVGVGDRVTKAIVRYGDGWRKHESLWKQEKGALLDKFAALASPRSCAG